MDKTKVILITLGLMSAFAFGRWGTPVKVVEKTAIVEVEKKMDNKQTDIDRDLHKETTVTEKVTPDGIRITETKTKEDRTTEKRTQEVKQDDTSTKTESSKETVYPYSDVTISALVGVPISFTSTTHLYWGCSIQKPILGPVTVGLFGLSSGVAGISLGLTL